MTIPDPRDPGWRPVWKRLHLAIIPQIAMAASRSNRIDPLTGLRLVYVSLVIGLGLLLSVLLTLGLDLAGDASLWLVLVGLAFAVAVAGSAWARRPLDGHDARTVATSYRTAMFIQVAFAVAVPLFGFSATFLTDSLSPYVLGLVLAAPLLWRAAPTASDIARRQEQLSNRGTNVALLQAILIR